MIQREARRSYRLSAVGATRLAPAIPRAVSVLLSGLMLFETVVLPAAAGFETPLLAVAVA